MNPKFYALLTLSLVATVTLPVVNGKLSSLVPAVIAQNTDARKAEADRLLQQGIQQVQDSEALNLVKQGEEEFQQGQSQKAFETFKEALKLAR